MPLRPVPWAIGNGAENSVELARAGIYSATSGATGITEPTDFKVTELPVPGGAVRVNQGGGVIKSTYPGVFGQSYAVQEQSHTDVPVSATGSSGGATKYVYVLIKDTQYSGQTPPSVEDGPYNEYAVSTTLPQNEPYLLLAEIEQPASTATITAGMITDRRTIANPLWKEIPYSRPRVSADGGAEQFLTSTIPGRGEWFPGGAGFENGFSITMPDFAVRMHIEAWWLAVTEDGSKNAYGSYWVEFGDERNTDGKWGTSEGIDLEYEFKTQLFGWNTTGAGNEYKNSWGLADNIAIPKKLRGKRVAFHFKAGIAGGSGASNNPIQMKADSGMMARLMFIQEPESQQVN